jgi:hypothetical protein
MFYRWHVAVAPFFEIKLEILEGELSWKMTRQGKKSSIAVIL